jgi:tetratricopeptide (TPR) repeat protein
LRRFGRPVDSVKELIIAVQVDREKVLQAAQKLVEKKRYDKAILEYERLVADDPRDVRTLLKIGDLYTKQDLYPEAIGTYERVAQFYAAQGHAVKAIAVYKNIRDTIRKHAPHLEDRFGYIVPKLAEYYIQLGLTSDALAAYDEMATRLQRAGRDRDAIDIFKKVVDLDPSNPIPYLRLAEAFVRVSDIASAITRFGAAGEILRKLGRLDDAIKVLDRLLQHRKDGRFARMAAELYLERGGPSDAMSALAKLQISFHENSKDLDTLALLARIFDRLGQPSKSIEVQKEAARTARDGGQAEAFVGLVQALVARAPNDEEVQKLAAQAERAGPSSIPAPRSLAPSDVEVYEEVDVDEVPAPEVPFALRQPAHAPYAAPADPAMRVRQVIALAEALRRGRNYDDAAATLRSAVAELPDAYELHEKLCDLLIEVGDQEGAIGQMLTLARRVAQRGDADGAARVLDEVLLLDPSRAEALRMLSELGYALPGADLAAPAMAEARSYEAPLPSYDLEEVGADEAIYRRPDSIRPPAFAQPIATGKLDDPFGEAPLPSFPIDDEASAATAAVAAYPAHAPAVAPLASLDEDALEEAEFFVAHGMFEEARAILDEQLTRLPSHPLLVLRRQELDAAMAAQASGEREVPRAGSMAHASQALDHGLDIAASLDALDALDAFVEGGAEQEDPRQIDVESVFEQFKAGVKAQISESDASTHYDLGVAYREMGLTSDAIHEFELASRDSSRECVCWSLIGMLRLEHGEIDAAIDAFIRGLHASERTAEQEVALTYEIGNAYELRNNPEQALYYFQLVGRADPSYRDPRGLVQDRIRRLTPAPAPAVSRVVNTDLLSDDFDAVFDDLLSGKKLP